MRFATGLEGAGFFGKRDIEMYGGCPWIRGLRIAARDALSVLATGLTRGESLENYPLVEAGNITAALQYAALQADHTVMRVV